MQTRGRQGGFAVRNRDELGHQSPLREWYGIVVCALTAVVFCAERLPGQMLLPDDPRRGVAASPEQDDATLHDVAFAGQRVGLAVGDRGVIWRTEDGGRNWEFRPTPTTASLRSVCLLTDRVGWAAGLEVAPETRIVSGVVLMTSDGGRSWKRINETVLPGLCTVQFFDTDHGCVAGQSSLAGSSGVWTTLDGGRTWSPAPGARSEGWTAAAFRDPRNGVLIGERNQRGTLGNGQLLPLRRTLSLRGLRDVVLPPARAGWLVGDGALLLHSTDGGASWPEPPGPLPRELGEQQNFCAVAACGDCVWVGGAPGSVIWHSRDAGVTWHPQSTGDYATICGLDFVDEQRGCAVGLFGTIRTTEDGGRTWTTVRGGGRRAALLTVQARDDDFPALLTSRDAGEHGYRSLGLVVTRPDAEASSSGEMIDPELLRAAELLAGGNDLLREWRLPLDAPELDHQFDALVASWSRRHEQRLPQVMLGGLVSALRTYRPEVLVYDEPGSPDGVGRLLHEALSLAVAQAADPTRFPEQRTLLGLEPWAVPKVFCRTRDPQAAVLTIDPHQVLLRQGCTLKQAARRAAGCAFSPAEFPLEREGYRLTQLAPSLAAMAGDAPSSSPLARGLFAGLNIPPDSAARRAQPVITALPDEQLAAMARHQRNFDGFTRQLLDDPVRAAQVIAQLRETTAPLPPAEAARLLADLAEQYRQRGQWELLQDVAVQLIEHYPEQPAAHATMRWLLARWTSQEVLWRDLQTIAANSPQSVVSPEILQANYERAVAAASDAERAAAFAAPEVAFDTAVGRQTRPSSVRTGQLSTLLDQSRRTLEGSPAPTGVNQWQVEIARRWQQAQRLERIIQVHAPQLHAQPDVQFIRAALLRATGESAAANEIYRSLFGVEEGLTLWNSTARGELWTLARGPVSPKPVLACRRASRPPILDGRLGDPCWNAAAAVELRPHDPWPDDLDPTFVGDQRLAAIKSGTATDQAAVPRPTLRLSYDEQHLYWLAIVPRAVGLPVEPVQLAGREYDATLTGHDRLSLAFDVDRDYATWYRFEVDQRGWTREALCDEQGWNPQWYVAADGDAAEWRVEAAIPWTALTPTPPVRGTVWAADLTRIAPTVALEAWTHPAGVSPRGETFGLVQFE